MSIHSEIGCPDDCECRRSDIDPRDAEIARLSRINNELIRQWGFSRDELDQARAERAAAAALGADFGRELKQVRADLATTEEQLNAETDRCTELSMELAEEKRSVTNLRNAATKMAEFIMACEPFMGNKEAEPLAIARDIMKEK